jgi:hypothetical protein
MRQQAVLLTFSIRKIVSKFEFQIVLDAQQPRSEVHPILENNHSLGNLVLCRYSIVDGEAMHSSAPETFWIPGAKERAAVRPGEYAKIVFRLDVECETVAERMWVQVTQRQGPSYVGRIANTPRWITALRFGDLVRFEARNVIKIATADACTALVLNANVRDVEPGMHAA